MKEINKYRVNWIDGMKINKNHFIDLENSFLHAVKTVEEVNLTPTNYGLLPDFSERGSSIELSISLDGQNSVEVNITHCKAVTLGGYQIDISESTRPLLEQAGCELRKKIQISGQSDQYSVVLIINPYQRITVGAADPEEEPPRRPYVLPEYKIDILESSELNNKELGLHHLTIGSVQLVDGKLSVINDFIPPSKSIQSHIDLKQAYDGISTFFGNLEAHLVQIIQKIHQKKQDNDLALMVLQMSQKMLDYINYGLTDFKIQTQFSAPIELVVKTSTLARIIKNSLDVFSGAGKEEFLNYISDWGDLNQGGFETIMSETIDNKYQHTNINPSLDQISRFTRIILTTFKKLNELDYIGKKSDSNIFVKENVVDKTNETGRRSFLLD
jgi:hypothetical protein